MTAAGPSVSLGRVRTRPRCQAIPLGRRTGTALGDLARVLATWTGAEAWWSPGVFAPAHRAGRHWQASAIVAADIDYRDDSGAHAAVTPEAWAPMRAALRGGAVPCNLAHRTPRGGRLVLLLDEVVTDAARWRAAAEGVVALVGRALAAAGVADRYRLDAGATIDRARQFWAPGATVDGVARRAVVATLRVAPYGVAGLVAAAPPPPAPRPRPAPAAPPSTDRAGRYALKALDGELRMVAAAPVGARNRVLNRSAFSLGQLAGAGLLDAHRVGDELVAAAVSNGLSAREARTTVASGLRAGLANPRGVPA